MKKLSILLLGILLLSGCNNNQNNNAANENNQNEQNISLKEPILNWCQLYNPNGFNTITCVITNPNNEDIDITYDLVFYKDGKEVDRKDSYSNFQVSNKHNEVIWSNSNILSNEKVDEIKMENIIVSPASKKSINAEIKYKETIENEIYFIIKHEKTPTIDNVTIFLYKDKNNNDICDKGELVITDTYTSTSIEDTFSIETDGIDYDSYEIYYNAY